MPKAPCTRLTLQCLAENTRFAQHPTRTACWIWTGRVGTSGYPVSHYDGQDRSARSGTWELMRGERPTGDLRTECGQQMCVNPHHMKVAAHKVMA